MKKKFLSMLVVALTFVFVACANNATNNNATETTKSEETAPAKKVYKVGLGQFAEHGSLDNCRNGFIEGMKEEGLIEGENVTYLYDNAQTDGSAAQQIYNKYVKFIFI